MVYNMLKFDHWVQSYRELKVKVENNMWTDSCFSLHLAPEVQIWLKIPPRDDKKSAVKYMRWLSINGFQR